MSADRFVRRATIRSTLFAVAFVGLLGVFAWAAPPDPPKPNPVSCTCCKCRDCACDKPAVPDQLPRRRPVQGIIPKLDEVPPKGADATGPVVTFEEALRDQIEGRPETIRTRRVLAVLDMEPGPRRDRILARMERHAAVHLELKGEPGKIDWGKVDWAKVFDAVVKILSAILPFLLMAEAGTGVPVGTLLALCGIPIGVG